MEPKVTFTNTKTGEVKTMTVSEARGLGIPDSAILNKLKTTPQPTETTPPPAVATIEQTPQKSVSGFLGNILKSGASTVGGIGNALINVLNPNLEKNTIANLGRLGIGAGQLLIPGEQGSEKYARAAGDFYNQRYGISELLKGDLKGMGAKSGETLYQDPVGAALDLSAVLGLGGGALSKTGQLTKATKLSQAGAKASELSRIVDPLQAVGRVVNPKLSSLVSKTATGVEDIGKTMPTKILKATAPRVKKFEEVLPKGTTIDDFMRENNLVGSGPQAFKKSSQLIEQSQKEYNALARSATKTVSPADYVKAIDDEIASIKSSNYTSGAKKVVNELEKEKKSFLEGTLSNNETTGVPIEKFTNMKTTTLGKASKLDPYKLDAQRLAGNAMISVIEKYAPGSSEIGKRLQQLREFNALTAKVPSGVNTNLLGILKPTGSGAAIGAMVGGVPGAAIGVGAGIASQNPTLLKLLGRSAQATGANLPGIAQKTAGALSSAEQTGNIARLLTPRNNENNQDQQQSTNNSQGEPIILPQVQPTAQTIPQPTAQPQQNYITGKPPEEHYQAYLKALANNDTAAAKQIKTFYDDEVAYQKENATGGRQLTEAAQARVDMGDLAKSALDMLETTKPKTGMVAGPLEDIKAKVGMGDEATIAFNTTLAQLKATIAKARAGTSFTPNEEKLLNRYAPTVGDSEQQLRVKLKGLISSFSK